MTTNSVYSHSATITILDVQCSVGIGAWVQLWWENILVDIAATTTSIANVLSNIHIFGLCVVENVVLGF